MKYVKSLRNWGPARLGQHFECMTQIDEDTPFLVELPLITSTFLMWWKSFCCSRSLPNTLTTSGGLWEVRWVECLRLWYVNGSTSCSVGMRWIHVQSHSFLIQARSKRDCRCFGSSKQPSHLLGCDGRVHPSPCSTLRLWRRGETPLTCPWWCVVW